MLSSADKNYIVEICEGLVGAILKNIKDMTAQEFTQLYGQGAIRLHPDKNKTEDATQVFQLLQACYRCLEEMGG